MLSRAFVSGPLTNSRKKEFYEEIGKVLNECGIDSYIPHINSAPKLHPGGTPHDIYHMNIKALESCHLVIAYVGTPSLGVGAELQKACDSGIPIILMYEEDAKVSNFIRGMPKVVGEIKYSTEVRGLELLKIVLIAIEEA